MTQRWYLAQPSPTGPQATGPLSLDELRQLATAGRVGPRHMVFAEGTEQWLPAGHVPALAPLFAEDDDTLRPEPALPGAAAEAPASLAVTLATVGIVFTVVVLVFCTGTLAVVSIGRNASTTFSAVGSKLASAPPRQEVLTRDQFRGLVRGQTPAGVRNLLGPPDVTHVDKDGEVWLYRNRTIDVDSDRPDVSAFILFRDGRVADVLFK